VAAVYPLSPSREHLVDLAVSPEFESVMQGLPTQAFVDGLIRPVRAITDRQGKGWRSMGLLLAAAVVGGDPALLERFASFPEFLHTGSLIIDDIQVRRAGRGRERGGAGQGRAAAGGRGCWE
jgi:geranylgeranyl pyrophosphate synthase